MWNSLIIFFMKYSTVNAGDSRSYVGVKTIPFSYMEQDHMHCK